MSTFAHGQKPKRRAVARLHWRAITLLGAVLLPQAAAAQAATYARFLLAFGQAYEDNLLATSARTEQRSDLITRAGPVLEAGYISVPLTLEARYAVYAERFLRHAEFNRDRADQDTSLTWQYRPTRRLEFDLSSSYRETQRPRELSLESGLALGRVRASRLTAGQKLTYEWTPVRRLHDDYEFSQDAVADGPRAAVQSARVGLEVRPTTRTSYRTNYRFYRFSFDRQDTQAAHVVTMGLQHQISRRTTLDLELGPRVSSGNGRVQPEISVSAARRIRRNGLGISYVSTETALVGFFDPIRLQRVMVFIAYHPTRHLSVTAGPTFIDAVNHGQRASIYGLELEAIHRASQRVSVGISAATSLQVTAFTSAGERIPYSRLALKLIVEPPGLTFGNRVRRRID